MQILQPVGIWLLTFHQWEWVNKSNWNEKSVNRKVKGVPQSQAAAKPRHHEEEKKDKNQRVKNKQTNAQEVHRPTLCSPNEVISQC